jgi:MFS transporter, DHA3 family, tetracycline resistance protein
MGLNAVLPEPFDVPATPSRRHDPSGTGLRAVRYSVEGAHGAALASRGVWRASRRSWRVSGARRDLESIYVRWTWSRAALHRGWWLVTSVYLVVDGRLTVSQLVLVGAAQSVVGLVFEVPAGVVADTFSRRWSLVVSHVLMGVAMSATALVTSFGLLVLTQMVWGLAWTFASGADVAWVTDELQEPARISSVLSRAGRAQLTGAVAGLIVIGGLSWLTRRETAMFTAGIGMLALGAYVALAFPESRFVRTRSRRWAASWSIFRRAWALARSSRVVLVILATTFVVAGFTNGIGRLYSLRVVDVGVPTDPVLWLTVVSTLTLVAGSAVLRLVEPSIDRGDADRRAFGLACLVAAVGAAGLALAREPVGVTIAIFLTAGASPLTRTFSAIWLNRQATGTVRATVHSLQAQVEGLGGIVCGLGLAALASTTSTTLALLVGAVVIAGAAVLIMTSSAGSQSS